MTFDDVVFVGVDEFTAVLYGFGRAIGKIVQSNDYRKYFAYGGQDCLESLGTFKTLRAAAEDVLWYYNNVRYVKEAPG